MSYAEMDVNTSNIEKQILWGITATTQELKNNYEVIIDHNRNNPEWSSKEIELVENELDNIRKLHDSIDSKLNKGQSLSNSEVSTIIEENRRAQEIESLLERKEKEGNLEMGGKNTVKLTKSLREFSKALKTFEENKNIQTDSFSQRKFADMLKTIGNNKGFETDNAEIIFGGIAYRGNKVKFDQNATGEIQNKAYERANYLVVDSQGFPYKERDFEDFLKTQPDSGKLNYEELLSENIFSHKLPLLMPDVLPTDNYRGFDLTKIDHYNRKFQFGAGIIGNGVFPAAGALATAGVLPEIPVSISALWVYWGAFAKGTILFVFGPRIFTALGARTAIFCEKLERFAKKNNGKPSFFLQLKMNQAPLVYVFMKSPKLRKLVIEAHGKAGFRGLRNGYIDYMEDIKFSSSGPKEIMIEYNGNSTIQKYNQKTLNMGILSDNRGKNSGEDDSGGFLSNLLG